MKTLTEINELLVSLPQCIAMARNKFVYNDRWDAHHLLGYYNRCLTVIREIVQAYKRYKREGINVAVDTNWFFYPYGNGPKHQNLKDLGDLPEECYVWWKAHKKEKKQNKVTVTTILAAREVKNQTANNYAEAKCEVQRLEQELKQMVIKRDKYYDIAKVARNKFDNLQKSFNFKLAPLKTCSNFKELRELLSSTDEYDSVPLHTVLAIRDISL